MVASLLDLSDDLAGVIVVEGQIAIRIATDYCGSIWTNITANIIACDLQHRGSFKSVKNHCMAKIMLIIYK